MRPGEAPPLYGLVLAGGYSRRMGADKAALEYHGEPEVRRMYTLLCELCAKAWVSIRDDQLHQPQFEEVDCIVDDAPGMGPVAGVLTALQRAPEAAWLVAACDMPLMDRETLERLIAGRDPGRDVTAFRASDGGVEPLCAVYEPSMRGVLAAGVAEGVYGLRRMLERCDVKLIESEGKAAASANTPEDRARFEALVQRQGPLSCR